MRTTKSTIYLCVAICLFTNYPIFGQGFVNLDFENAVIVLDPSLPYYPYSTYTASAMPGWAVSGNFLGSDVILYDDLTISSASVSIHDGGGFNGGPGITPLQGSYSVYIRAQFDMSIIAAIAQVGQVPVEAQTITLLCNDGVPQLLFDGQAITLTAMNATPDFTVYVGNIAPFAGQTGELRIQGYGTVDNIQFLVPEPSALSLFGLGLLGLFWQRRKGSR